MERGIVDFEKKVRKEFYFKTSTQTFSVSDKGFYDFKAGSGGQIIKAVMEMEGIKWKEALDFYRNFQVPITTISAQASLKNVCR